MARKATVDREIALQMLREGRSTQYVADYFGVSRQAVDLHRGDFIKQGLLNAQRAARRAKTEKSTKPVDSGNIPLDRLIDLIIEAFTALKQVPELETELEKYKRCYEDATREIEHLQNSEQKRHEQEERWQQAQKQGGTQFPLSEK